MKKIRKILCLLICGCLLAGCAAKQKRKVHIMEKQKEPETATKIRLIWDAIPSRIARDNNKF